MLLIFSINIVPFDRSEYNSGSADSKSFKARGGGANGPPPTGITRPGIASVPVLLLPAIAAVKAHVCGYGAIAGCTRAEAPGLLAGIARSGPRAKERLAGFEVITPGHARRCHALVHQTDRELRLPIAD